MQEKPVMQGQKKRKKCSGLLAVRALLRLFVFFLSSVLAVPLRTRSLSAPNPLSACYLVRGCFGCVCALTWESEKERKNLDDLSGLIPAFSPPNRAAASPGPARQLLSPRGQDVPDAKLRRRDYIQAEPGRSPQCGMPGPTRPAYYHILV